MLQLFVHLSVADVQQTEEDRHDAVKGLELDVGPCKVKNVADQEGSEQGVTVVFPNCKLHCFGPKNLVKHHSWSLNSKH